MTADIAYNICHKTHIIAYLFMPQTIPTGKGQKAGAVVWSIKVCNRTNLFKQDMSSSRITVFSVMKV